MASLQRRHRAQTALPEKPEALALVDQAQGGS
jgi:hypothetical protein